MTFLSVPILTFLIFFPVVASLLLLPFYKRTGTDGAVKWIALGITVIEFLLSLSLLIGNNPHLYQMQFVENHLWIPFGNIHYALGIDGISLVLIVMTTFLMPMTVLTSWVGISKNIPLFMINILVLEGAMIGVFCATDFVLFYVFWEAMLIPMYLIIGVWGGPNRIYAAIKFFLYTLAGSLLLLVAIIALYFVGGHTFDITRLSGQHYGMTFQILAFLAMFVAFAVKIPMFPFHTWLPDAHVEAPTAGSVILASIMLKMGAYGFLRFSLPMFPDASRFFTPFMLTLSVIAIIWGAFMALAQEDMKKLIAYSSIAHMGFVTLGAFVVYEIVRATGGLSGAAMGMDGAMVQMVSHGLISGAMFLCVGVLYDRMHSRQIADYGGVVNTMPIFGAFMVLFALANTGLPGTSGFVGEFLVILASFKAGFWFSALAAVTLILGATYTLWMVKRVVFGPVGNDHVAKLTDLDGREFLILGVLAAAVLLVGVWPEPLLKVMEPSIRHLVAQAVSTKIPV